MSLLGEELAEEWLNRQGFFTIRGTKIGNGEIDLLAVKCRKEQVECWHYEVQASLRPVSYICPAPKLLRQEGKSAFNAKKRDLEEIKTAVSEWIDKKFKNDAISEKRKALWPGHWQLGFIVGNVKHSDELELIKESGIKVVKLVSIIEQMSREWHDVSGEFVIDAASGADLVDLVHAQNQLKE